MIMGDLCWLLSISVPKKSAKDGSTGSFSLQFMHQQVRKGFLYNFLLPDFRTDMLSSQHSSAQKKFYFTPSTSTRVSEKVGAFPKSANLEEFTALTVLAERLSLRQ